MLQMCAKLVKLFFLRLLEIKDSEKGFFMMQVVLILVTIMIFDLGNGATSDFWTRYYAYLLKKLDVIRQNGKLYKNFRT